MKIKPLPSLEYLRECFELDAVCPSGLRWRKRPRQHFSHDLSFATFDANVAGKPAGGIVTDKRRGKQYYKVYLNNDSYYAHRIVFSLFNEQVISIETQVDHRNGSGTDNSTNNLRSATHNQNRFNVKTPSSNTSGIKGVSWHKRNKCWRYSVSFRGKIYQGGAPTVEKAHEIGKELREKLHKEFTNHG